MPLHLVLQLIITHNCFLLVTQRGITLFTVSHRKSLWKYHEVGGALVMILLLVNTFVCTAIGTHVHVGHIRKQAVRIYAAHFFYYCCISSMLENCKRLMAID